MLKKPMTTEERFDKIKGILKEKDRLPEILDYGLGAYRPVPIKTYEFDLKSNLAHGGTATCQKVSLITRVFLRGVSAPPSRIIPLIWRLISLIREVRSAFSRASTSAGRPGVSVYRTVRTVACVPQFDTMHLGLTLGANFNDRNLFRRISRFQL